jgi:hypothetical protein
MQKATIYGILVSIVLLFMGCSKAVDFEQVKDAQPEPIIELSLVYSNLNAGLFTDDIAVTNFVIRDTTRVDFFTEDFYQDNVIRTDIIAEYTNTINSDFEVRFLFVNDNFQQQYEISTTIPEGQLGSPVIVNIQEVFENQSLEALKATTQIILEFSLINSQGNTINNSTPGNLLLKSKGIVYFEVDL